MRTFQMLIILLVMCFILISYVHLNVTQVYLLVKLQMESNFVAQADCNPKLCFKSNYDYLLSMALSMQWLKWGVMLFLQKFFF